MFLSQQLYIGVEVGKSALRFAALRKSRKGWAVINEQREHHDLDYIHGGSRPIEPDRNRFGLCCFVRPAHFEAPR